MRTGKLTRREVRTITISAVVSVVAVFFSFVALPYARRWSAREEMIVAGADRIARLRNLMNDESHLRDLLRAREGLTGARSLVAGRTAALAGADLQRSIQSYAARSKVTISRLDLAGSPDSAASTLPSIPASLSAVGDVYGISEFLSMIESGTPVMDVKQLTLVSNSSLRGGLLQLSLTLAAPSVIE